MFRQATAVAVLSAIAQAHAFGPVTDRGLNAEAPRWFDLVKLRIPFCAVRRVNVRQSVKICIADQVLSCRFNASRLHKITTLHYVQANPALTQTVNAKDLHWTTRLEF